MYYLIILATIISCGLSDPISTCPEIKAVPKFNFTAYLKDGWYEIARYNNYFETTDDCTYLKFDATEKGVVFDLEFILKHKFGHVDGIIDSNNGVLYFRSKNFKGGVIPITIIDIDYDKYAVGYYCEIDEKTNKKQDMAWIVCRTKNMDDATKAIIEDIFHNNMILDRSKFFWEQFTNQACNAD